MGTIISRVLLAMVMVALGNLMRMLDLCGRIRASHVNKRDCNEQQTMKEGSHLL